AAELLHLLYGVHGHVAGAGDHDPLAVEGRAARLQHLLDEERAPVAGGLGPYLRSPVRQALARDHAGLVAVGDALVLAEQVADLPAADADVTGGHVRVLAYVPEQLSHEALAEPHDLAVGAPLGVEVGTALAAADGQAGEAVLEDLLEPEEFHYAQVDRGVEAQSTLVRAERAVELDPEAAVDVDLAAVVLPGHPEDDLPFGLADPLNDLGLGVFGVFAENRADAFEHLPHRLVEFDLPRVAAQYVVINRRQLLVQHGISQPICDMRVLTL